MWSSAYRSQATPARPYRGLTLAVVAVMSVLALGACMHVMHMFSRNDIEPPPAEVFGYGPRTSDGGLYSASVEPAEQPIRVGRMHAWRLEVRDAAGAVVDGASIEVDGGMPQHGHGMPSKPRVTRELGDGTYAVEGMKFNMGGWWTVTFRIAAPAGRDSVTFNLSL